MEKPAGVIEVRPSHRFDKEKLSRYMETHVEGFSGALDITQFEGGQSNPTYFLSTPDQKYVLRRKPPGQLIPSAHQVDREYRVITALRATGVPVPRTFALCEDEAVIGTPFFIMEYMPGRIFADPFMPECTPPERKAITESLISTLAVFHQANPKAVGLESFGPPKDYIARQVHRWSKIYRFSETQAIPAMEKLMAWLPENIPPGDETTIVHGDFRLGNMIVHPEEPRIIAVLDWELSTLGHPLSDLAYIVSFHRLDNENLKGFGGVNLEELGIPNEEEIVGLYCQKTGRKEIPQWDFYVAFNIFRSAAIAQGIMGRVRDGTANDTNAEWVGSRAPALADRAWEVAQMG